jgi:hypothetical protein
VKRALLIGVLAGLIIGFGVDMIVLDAVRSLF